MKRATRQKPRSSFFINNKSMDEHGIDYYFCRVLSAIRDTKKEEITIPTRVFHADANTPHHAVNAQVRKTPQHISQPSQTSVKNRNMSNQPISQNPFIYNRFSVIRLFELRINIIVPISSPQKIPQSCYKRCSEGLYINKADTAGKPWLPYFFTQKNPRGVLKHQIRYA